MKNLMIFGVLAVVAAGCTPRLDDNSLPVRHGPQTQPLNTYQTVTTSSPQVQSGTLVISDLPFN